MPSGQTESVRTATMASINPFSKSEISGNFFIYTIKTNATWEQVNEYLENHYGKNGKDLHWKWRGFGEEGDPKFQVLVSRRFCSPHICECRVCSMCERFTCEKVPVCRSCCPPK